MPFYKWPKENLVKIIADDQGHKGEKAIDIMMITKYLERIGDHATNIAEWVIFSVTGEHIQFRNVKIDDFETEYVLRSQRKSR